MRRAEEGPRSLQSGLRRCRGAGGARPGLLFLLFSVLLLLRSSRVVLVTVLLLLVSCGRSVPPGGSAAAPPLRRRIALVAFDDHRDACPGREEALMTSLERFLQDSRMAGNPQEDLFILAEGLCSAPDYLRQLLQLIAFPETDAVVGAIRSADCEAAAALANIHKKPLFTWSCMQVQQPKESLLRQTAPSLEEVGGAVLEVVSYFCWKRCIVFTTEDSRWLSLSHHVEDGMALQGYSVKHLVILPSRGHRNASLGDFIHLFTMDIEAVIFCMPVETVILMVVQSVKNAFASSPMNLVWLLMSPFSVLDPSLPLKVVQSSENAALPCSFYFMSLTGDTASARKAPEGTWSDGSQPTLPGYAVDDDRDFSQLAYDALVAFAASQAGRQPRDGTSFFHSDADHSHPHGGFDPAAARTYRLVEWDGPSLSFSLVLRLRPVNGTYSALPPSSNVSMNEGCHFRKSCSSGTGGSHLGYYLLITGAVLLPLLAIGTAFFFTKRFLLRNLLKSAWQDLIVSPESLDFSNESPLPGEKPQGNIIENVLDLKNIFMFPLPSVRSCYSERGTFKGNKVYYNDNSVHFKHLVLQGHFEPRTKFLKLLKQFRDLRHENINQFIGILLDTYRPALLFEYGSRGSLYDFIHGQEMKLDWPVKLHLLGDLVKGMKFLHSSPVGVHGHLTSKNCIVDGRWTLKVTDYAVCLLHAAQKLPHPHVCPEDLLWHAPEVLRDEDLLHRGTTRGDVFSFAIVMQEIIAQALPYHMLHLPHEEIINKLKKLPPTLIRPSISKQMAPLEAIGLMKACWDENPENRPTFRTILEVLKKMNHGRKLNIVDTMLSMLEKYSNNLEGLVRERTKELHIEKRKTEQLLNRMLPGYVAEQLKLGLRVDPEEFQEVTIYFSDIVDFTSISVLSTPFEVVDLLNDLYSCFDSRISAYDVYKVETIGDAYMVVSGAPIRIEDHAEQISTMALDLLHESGKFKIRHMPERSLMLRIGIHTGPVCAGVVGITMPRYCLFGDTVNTASRMESTGAACKIHISSTTKEKLESAGGYDIQFRGEVELKGKGKHPTYWLLGKVGFVKQLPDVSGAGRSPLA